ncbi:MAG: quinolinate synthase NadA [Lentisphaerae bacterium]|nr:quinolinate synthase NadA [Lentisphaerota bacterium]
MTSISARIRELARQRQAVILAHNYQAPEVQDVADFCGDSLELSRQAAAAGAEVIIFCGVYFMAETAAILSPSKTVLIPDPQAGCPMVSMAPVEAVRELKAKHPGAMVVTYVNSSAEVKAESDICCTSANAAAVVAGIDPAREIIFVPDQHLGHYVQQVTGRKMILYPGCCPTHARLAPADIVAARQAYPDAVVMIHPECRPEAVALADAVLSTSGMLRYPRESPATTFIVATETAMLHRLRKENPGKTFHPASDLLVCPNMKRITLEKVLWSLEDMKHVVTVPEPVRIKALRAVERMVRVG